MTVAEIRALPVAFDLTTANKALCLSRTTGYAMAQNGEYPVPLLRLGVQYRARRADLLTLLGIAEQA